MGQSSSSNNRSWTWTPSPAMNGVMATILRLPLLHRILSGSMLLITFTGRKTGKRYTTPVGYLREGNSVTILTKRFRRWWRNFEEPAPVELLLAGRKVRGQATALTDEAAMVPFITRMIAHEPRGAEIYGVRVENGEPQPDDVRELAPKVVVIRVELSG